MKGGSMQSEACRWRWTFREEGGGTRSGGQEWPVEASRRATVLAFSPPPFPLLNRFYEQKSGKLLRLEIDSTSSRNRRILPVSQFLSYLFTPIHQREKLPACSIDLQIVHRDIPIFEISKKVNVSFSLLFFFFESSTRITRKGDENVRSFRNYFVAY